ncbi:MAG: class I SAM-dependent methyltransferase [Solirubrobacterales bacterium]
MELFASPPEHYDRFMGRYSAPLAAELAEASGIDGDLRVLDVGCGPGALTAELARRVGAERVSAIDPAEQFVAACRSRAPGADVRVGAAEQMPWADGEFDAALSCLVLAHVADAAAVTGEMARVTRPGGAVASCMWDFEEGGMKMLRIFWSAIRDVRPGTERTENRPGTDRGGIAALLAGAGLTEIVDSELTVAADYSDFDDFWVPFTFGVGPSGKALASLTEDEHTAVRETCRSALPGGPFTLDARAWFARGTVPG